MIREPYTRFTFSNLVVIPLAALAIVAGFNWLGAKTPAEAERMAKFCLGSAAALVMAVWLKHSARRRRMEAHKRVLRLSRQSGVCDGLIAKTQRWSYEHLEQLQREMDEEDREGTPEHPANSTGD